MEWGVGMIFGQQPTEGGQKESQKKKFHVRDFEKHSYVNLESILTHFNIESIVLD